jgi:hypothetical protein
MSGLGVAYAFVVCFTFCLFDDVKMLLRARPDNKTRWLNTSFAGD